MPKQYNDMWYMLTDHKRYVYHYTKANTLIDVILPTRQLRLSRFQNVNDPKEYRDWIFGYQLNRILSDDFAVDFLSEDANNVLKRDLRIGCFVVDPPSALMTREVVDNNSDIFNEAPYERGHSRPGMWAHYGENHSGACLIFDRYKLDHAIRRTCSEAAVSSDAIQYKNRKWLLDIRRPNELLLRFDDLVSDFNAEIEAHYRTYRKELFFTKSPDWESEREYRWLVRWASDDELFIPIDDCLVGIALGDKFSHCSVLAVRDLAREIGAAVSPMKWNNGFPQFV